MTAQELKDEAEDILGPKGPRCRVELLNQGDEGPIGITLSVRRGNLATTRAIVACEVDYYHYPLRLFLSCLFKDMNDELDQCGGAG